jgi:hypothetical protein
MKLGKVEDMDTTALLAYHYHNTINSRTSDLSQGLPAKPGNRTST